MGPPTKPPRHITDKLCIEWDPAHLPWHGRVQGRTLGCSQTPTLQPNHGCAARAGASLVLLRCQVGPRGSSRSLISLVDPNSQLLQRHVAPENSCFHLLWNARSTCCLWTYHHISHMDLRQEPEQKHPRQRLAALSQSKAAVLVYWMYPSRFTFTSVPHQPAASQQRHRLLFIVPQQPQPLCCLGKSRQWAWDIHISI